MRNLLTFSLFLVQSCHSLQSTRFHVQLSHKRYTRVVFHHTTGHIRNHVAHFHVQERSYLDFRVTTYEQEYHQPYSTKKMHHLGDQRLTSGACRYRPRHPQKRVVREAAPRHGDNGLPGQVSTGAMAAARLSNLYLKDQCAGLGPRLARSGTESSLIR